MSKQVYDIEGDFQMGRMRQHFALQFAAESEEEAKDHAFADLGSRHGVSRRQISVKEIRVAGDDDISDITRKRLEKQ